MTREEREEIDAEIAKMKADPEMRGKEFLFECIAKTRVAIRAAFKSSDRARVALKKRVDADR